MGQDASKVSIPSNGSIQFLLVESIAGQKAQLGGLNPLKRVNSILTSQWKLTLVKLKKVSIPSSGSIQFLLNLTRIDWVEKVSRSQSPQAGQFNSYCYRRQSKTDTTLFKSQSPQAGQFNSYDTKTGELIDIIPESQSPQAGQFNSYKVLNLLGIIWFPFVSIPSSGSIQFLRDYYQ